MKRPVHINIVGRKKSGKTTLIQALTKELTSRGIRVGTVKHTSHDHDFDTPETDSWKHRQAGSLTTIILSPTRWVAHSSRPVEQQSTKWMDTILLGNDIILWEGDRSTHNPMIECVSMGDTPLFADSIRLIGIVSSCYYPDVQKHFSPNDPKALCDLIIRDFSIVRDQYRSSLVLEDT